MNLSARENIKMSLSAVWAHRFRSGLTILGIVIGITTVVTVSSLLTGLRKGVVTFFEEFGTDNIFITRFSGPPDAQGTPKQRKRKPIKPEYAELIERFCPSVEAVSVSVFIPTIVNRKALVAKVPGFESNNFFMSGYTANGFVTQPKEMKWGRVFTADEVARSEKVAAIGANLSEALFPGDKNPVGQTFNVDGAEYRIIGVFAPAKGGFFGENGFDRQVAIPLKTAQIRYPLVDNYSITVKARKGVRDEAQEEVRGLLRKLRKTPSIAEDDFSASTSDEIIRRFDALTGMIVLVSIAISGLGLLVGGIGVMNIMLVSVTERTREIGVRKAVGARRFDIVMQFLMEAVTLTGLGGLIGILVSVMVTFLVGWLVPSLPSEVPPWAVVVGFGVSVGVGLFFGVWPAVQAAKLDPVEALRYE
jgi:putative ABC transport system permease protein